MFLYWIPGEAAHAPIAMINYQEVHKCHAHVHILSVQPESGIFGLRELTWHISKLTHSGPNPPEYGCTQRQRCTCMHVRMYACMGVCTYLRTYVLYVLYANYIHTVFVLYWVLCVCQSSLCMYHVPIHSSSFIRLFFVIVGYCWNIALTVYNCYQGFLGI